jgi:hypothetical protein
MDYHSRLGSLPVRRRLIMSCTKPHHSAPSIALTIKIISLRSLRSMNMPKCQHPRVPYIYNLRTDPFERASITSNTYNDWLLDHAFILVPAQALVGQFLATFNNYPPRQKAASFTISQVLENMQQAHNSGD